MSLRPRRSLLLINEGVPPPSKMSTPKKTRRNLTDDLYQLTRRSPRISEKAQSGRQPTPPRPQRSVVVGYKEPGLQQLKANPEFSDDDLDNRLRRDDDQQPSTHLDKLAHLKKFNQLLNDMCKSFRDEGRRSSWLTIIGLTLAVIILILAILILPNHTNYLKLVSEQSRLIVLSVPEFLSRETSAVFNSFGSSWATDQEVNQKLDVHQIVNKLISNPEFIRLIRRTEESNVAGSQLTEAEVKLSTLLTNFASDVEARQTQIKAELSSLKNDMDAKVGETAGRIPDLKAKLDKIALELEAKLQKLDAELISTRHQLEEAVTASQQPTDGVQAPALQKISDLEAKLTSLSQEFSDLTSFVTNCKNSGTGDVSIMIKDLLDAKLPDFMAQLSARFVTDSELRNRMQNLSENFRREIEADVQQRLHDEVKKAVQAKIVDVESNLNVGSSTNASSSGTFTSDDVTRIVQEALMKYDADKTGLFDFALESAGGTIASTRCTETYDISTAVYSIWGVPIWWARSNPRTILQPGSSPGQCWPFKGSQGSVVVSLSNSVKITGVSLEHIPAKLSPDGSIASAPKVFEVYGLMSLSDESPELLGTFTYNGLDGPPVQTFFLNRPSISNKAYSLVELKVLSNHGNMAYTCIYRFRIHGHLDESSSN